MAYMGTASALTLFGDNGLIARYDFAMSGHGISLCATGLFRRVISNWNIFLAHRGSRLAYSDGQE